MSCKINRIDEYRARKIGERCMNLLENGPPRQGSLVSTENKLLLAFELHIQPRPQMRPKIAATPFGHAMAYKSERQKNAERELDAALAAHAPASPFAGPLLVNFVAAIQPPGSMGAKDRQRLFDRNWHTDTPDLDNLAKQLLDGMTRMRFWHDDRQVARLVCEKIYGFEPCWRVSLERMGAARQ